LNTRETVATDTPAARATSRIVDGMTENGYSHMPSCQEVITQAEPFQLVGLERPCNEVLERR